MSDGPKCPAPLVCEVCHRRPAQKTDSTGRLACGHCARGPRFTVTGSAAPCGRNDPCFCGSGKKYKRCHGRALGEQIRTAPNLDAALAIMGLPPIVPYEPPTRRADDVQKAA